MSLPYENSSSGKNAINDIQKILKSFGCARFASGEDFETGEIFVQFERRGRPVSLKASAKGYAAAWLKHHPYSSRMKSTKAQHDQKALNIGSIAVFSVLRDWVKGQVTAIEIGVLSFESAFLGHMMLPDGTRVIDKLEEMKMLPSPKGSE